jgi:hypothetical protein
MLSHKRVHNITILESVEKRWQTFGLVVQRKHLLMHQSKGALARLNQHSSLRDPILKKCQLHRLRPICPEVISNRIGVRVGGKKVRIHTAGFGGTVKAQICRKK